MPVDYAGPQLIDPTQVHAVLAYPVQQ